MSNADEHIKEMGLNVANYAAALNSSVTSLITVKDEANPKDILGIKRPPLHLVPPCLEIYTSLAFRNGAEKYGPFNWRDKKVKWSVYYTAARGHLAQAYDGEDVDPISGAYHIAHAVADLAILLDAMSLDCLIDDRPTKGASSKIIEQYTLK